MDFLKVNESYNTARTCKDLKKKCLVGDYLTKRNMHRLQQFFYHQFKETQLFFGRVTSCYSSLSNFALKNLPFSQNEVQPYRLFIDADPALAVHTEIGRSWGSRLQIWLELYRQVQYAKVSFVATVGSKSFETQYFVPVHAFLGDIFLDASESGNVCYALPPLSRETFKKKGLFWRTEKIVIENFNDNLSSAKNAFRFFNQLTTDIETDLKNKEVLEQLIGKQEESMEVDKEETSMSWSVVQYIFR